MPQSITITSEEDDDELTQEIEQQVNEWSSNSNECFIVKLVRGDGEVAESFNPEFTYAIFGEEEAIFGYQGLSITLSFAAHDLSPHLKIEYNKIFEAQGDVRPTDIKEALKEFLPASALREEQNTESSVADFKPPGEKIHEYMRNGKKYQTWAASLADPAARKLLTNMQILTPMFIDGGSTLELDFDWTIQRWKVFLVYEVDNAAAGQVSPYTLVGYGTSYRIFTFPDRAKADLSALGSSQSLDQLVPPPDSDPPPSDGLTPLDLPSRERLSQFLILPPFQGAGHGQDLYNTMYTHLTTPSNIHEFTVEDPNEKFDDLRDACDLLHLRATDPSFSSLRITPSPLPPTALDPSALIPTELIVPLAPREAAMRASKIMPRQFDRLVEMHTLSFIPPQHRSRNRITRRDRASNPHDRAYYLWRLYVKQRLYVFNRDQLAQVESAERVEKLEAALDSVQEAYGEMIERVERTERERRERESEVQTGVGKGRRKRKVVDDDDEDEEDGEGQEGVGGDGKKREVIANGHLKKARVE